MLYYPIAIEKSFLSKIHLGVAGATNSEIVSFSRQSVNSKVIDVYVQPSKKAAKHAHKKRWGKKQRLNRLNGKSLQNGDPYGITSIQ